MDREHISILFPSEDRSHFKTMSDTTIHDLGIDTVCSKLTAKKTEQGMILHTLSFMSDDPDVARYRGDIFEDIYNHSEMCDELMKILDKINFLRNYGSFKKDHEETVSVWSLMHRMDELCDYIKSVEAIYTCLSGVDLQSEGLKKLLGYVDTLYKENGFAELKKDMEKLKVSTNEIRSVTLGINLNDRFEAVGIGLVSINNRYFTKSGILSNFYDKISTSDMIHKGTDWDENYKFHPCSMTIDTGLIDTIDQIQTLKNTAATAIAKGAASVDSTVAAIPANDMAVDSTKYMDRIANHMLTITVRKLKEVLNKYISVTIVDITNLIPEFIYYIRFAAYIKSLTQQGFHFCKPSLSENRINDRTMDAKGVYNIKLASAKILQQGEIVTNDLDFSREHMMYILTGANRGGKTTITQAIGQLFVLAQGGIYVPGDSFIFSPVDCVYTHFPADEDKTMDLGRLGEECQRFKEIYTNCTSSSLLLLNETFSTTSFEEGYYIAKDSIKAMLMKGVRTIYNTHMHKLANNLEELNRDAKGGKAVSLIVKSDGGNRSFQVEIAPPEGMSYASDIAVKYGVTYEMLTK